jgi:hypothetical protein
LASRSELPLPRRLTPAEPRPSIPSDLHTHTHPSPSRPVVSPSAPRPRREQPGPAGKWSEHQLARVCVCACERGRVLPLASSHTRTGARLPSEFSLDPPAPTHRHPGQSRRPLNPPAAPWAHCSLCACVIRSVGVERFAAPHGVVGATLTPRAQTDADSAGTARTPTPTPTSADQDQDELTRALTVRAAEPESRWGPLLGYSSGEVGPRRGAHPLWISGVPVQVEEALEQERRRRRRQRHVRCQ